jgi:hypothetical protein
VGFIFVKFIKTTLGDVYALKTAEILLRLGPNKTRLDTTRGNEQGIIRSQEYIKTRLDSPLNGT